MYTYRLNVAVLGGLFLSQNIAHAQVVTDGTTGEGTALTGPNYQIGAELGTEAGDNLFHSFDQFSIETGGSATFSGPGNIENIVGRVTGGELSAIDGLIISTIPGASLFLFNPAGVVFGPNASLDVTGSFHVSSADELRTADGGRFSAVNPEANGFSVAAPESFGFLGADPAGITIAGSRLSVGPGETLSVVGGDIDIDGAGLLVEGGELNVLAVDGIAEANLETGELTGAGDGGISVGGGSSIASIGDGGGTIRIEGGEFVVDEASSVFSINDGAADGDVAVSIDTASTEITSVSLLVTSSQGAGRGGDLDINSESIQITGGSLVENNAQAGGRAGDTNLEAETIRVAEGSRIISTTLASGDGGDLNIDSETILFEGQSLAQTIVQADGNGGTINIAADDLTLTDGISAISSTTNGSGDGGAITVSSDELVIEDRSLIISSTSASGAGGAIAVDAGSITLIGGTILATTAEGSTGNGGDVNITAGSTELSAAQPGQGSTIGTGTFGEGDAGDITITGGSLLVDGGGQRTGAGVVSLSEQADNRGGRIVLDLKELVLVRDGNILADPSGDGADAASIDITADKILIDGGDRSADSGTTGISLDTAGGGDTPGTVLIRAGELDIQNGGVILSSTLGDTDASDIIITADKLSMGGDGGGIRTQINSNAVAGSTGNAGQVIITAGVIDLSGDASISSSTFSSGDAGVVSISARDSLELRDRSKIESSTEESSGDGGSVLINAGGLVILDDALIASSTAGSGRAGSIEVTAETALLDSRNIEGFSGITTQGTPGSTGDAGEIILVIDDLILKNTSQITSSAFGTGDAGAISVTSKTITIEDQGSDDEAITGISTSVQPDGVDLSDAGDAGAIVIEADQLILRGEFAEVASANAGAGLAGTIDIRLTEGLIIEDSSEIVTVSQSGGGGGITIQADEYIAATGPGSRIVTTVANDEGNAGDIVIETPVLGLGDASILAQADAGSGGDIQVTVDDLILSPAAEINAEAGATGVDGTVAVSSPETDVSGGLVAFDGRFLDVSSLLRERCAARRADESSSFTLGTGGALPADLDAPRLSLLQVRSEQDRTGQQTVLVLPCPKTAS